MRWTEARGPGGTPNDPGRRSRRGPRGYTGPRRLLRHLLAAILLPWAAGCTGPGVEHQGDPDLGATFGISPTPPLAGPAQVWVRPTDRGRPVPAGTRVQVAALPEAVPVGAPAEVSLSRGVEGRWTGDVVFAAPGPGRLQIQILLPDGRSATLRFPVTVSRRPGG